MPPKHAPLAFGDAFELRVVLRGLKPLVWRSVRVPAHLVLGDLHVILQVVMGWTDSHLHEFHVGECRFGVVDGDQDIFVIDENNAPLGGAMRVGSKFRYDYDFGDDWQHDVTVESVASGEGATLACLGGARACPPEDCGGPHRYADLLKALAKPKHRDHAELVEWSAGFDPDAFDVARVNAGLRALDKSLGLVPPPNP